MLLRALKLLGANAGFHIPHRFTEGYGIQQAALEKAVAEGYKLVVSVDCGIRAHEPLYWARDNGLDVIITDHHLPDEKEGAPPAFAVLNPNQAGCAYPDKNLAGVGVAFKLVHALFREHGREAQVPAFMKVVAIGTVADVAKLVGENRTIVAIGLKDLAQRRESRFAGVDRRCRLRRRQGHDSIRSRVSAWATNKRCRAHGRGPRRGRAL